MTTSMKENHCVIQGSLEDMAYKALFKQLLEGTASMPDELPKLNDLLTQKIKELQAQQNLDAAQKQQLADMEALCEEYLKYEASKKNTETKIKYIPIFPGEGIVSMEVIIPNCAHLNATIEDNPFTNRTAQAASSGTSITSTSGDLVRMGLQIPHNATYKVNYDSCSMTIDSSNKIVFSPNDNNGKPLDDDKIRLFQKHVLASVLSNPDAPIKLTFPKSMDDTEKFRIINEMIVAYMSATGTKGEIDTKGSEARREQFIKNLLAGNSIEYSDTIAIGHGDKPRIFTGGIKDFIKPSFVNESSTKEMVKEYQDSIKQLNRQGIMMDMLKNLDKTSLEKLAAEKPWDTLLAAREVVRSGTNAATGGLSTLYHTPGFVYGNTLGRIFSYPKTFRQSLGHGSSAQNDINDKTAFYSREGIDKSHNAVIKACMADIILEVAKLSLQKPVEENNIQDLPSFKKLSDTYNMQAGEVLAILNSPEVNKAIKKMNAAPPAPASTSNSIP